MKRKLTDSEKSSLVVLVIISFFTCFFLVSNQQDNLALIKEEQEKQNKEQELFRELSELSLEAQAFSIYNIHEHKRIFGKNDDVSMPIASLAKIMTVLVALEEDKGEIILISPSAIRQNGDSGLFLGEEWNLSDLTKFILLSSSNDGAYALSENTHAFLKKMNRKAIDFEMHNSLFLNPTGLDLETEEPQAGAFSSAKDVNRMSIRAFFKYPDVFGITSRKEVEIFSRSGILHVIQNTNIYTENIPGLLFSKTGYTDISGGNLSIIFENEKGQKIAVTLLDSSYFGRFQDMEKIVNLLYDY